MFGRSDDLPLLVLEVCSAVWGMNTAEDDHHRYL